MTDVTAGRAAGTALNAELDPTLAGEPQRRDPAITDVTAGRAAGTAWNAAKDPTRPATPHDPRR